ncbi:MAG: nuclear transport factor 2 family protein [Phycisphaerales bacterium]|nr:nuclear transport factor 2 family protein [Phycisphaerales bacterium]
MQHFPRVSLGLNAVIVSVALGLSCGCGQTTSHVKRVLDDWHDAAADADEDRYFGHMTDNAVFLGTDATERWTKAEFQAYAHPYFAKGQGWTYVPQSRYVMFGDSTRVAWFDEKLLNAKYGECRGTGVLERHDGRWLISHYNLTVPVPNDLLDGVVKMIRETPAAAPAGAPPR